MNGGQVSAAAQLCQKLMCARGGGQPVGAIGAAEGDHKAKECAGQAFRFGKAIDALRGQDVPDADQQLAGDGDNGFVVAQAGFEAGEFGAPMGMGAGGAVGGFDEGAAQVTASVFGEPPAAGGLPTVVDAGAQAGVADEVLGAGEAGDVADGGQQGHGGEEAHAGQLHQEGHALILGGEGFEQGFDVRALGLGAVEGGQIAVNAHLLGRGEVEVEPPIALGGAEGIAVGWGEVVAVQDGVQAVFGLGGQLDHLGALGDEGAQFAHCLRRDPDAAEQAGGVQFGQTRGGDFVVHHRHTGDEFDVRRVYHRHRMDVGEQFIVELVAVTGHLQHHCILGRQRLADPGFQATQLDTLRAKHRLAVGCHPDGDQVVLVHIQSDKALRHWQILGHRSLLCSVGQSDLPCGGRARSVCGTILHTQIRAVTLVNQVLPVEWKRAGGQTQRRTGRRRVISRGFP